MAITITRKPQVQAKVVVVESDIALSVHADLIDAVGKEAAELAVLELQMEDLKKKMKPLLNRKESLAELMTLEAKEAGYEPESNPIMLGQVYAVECAHQATSRVLTDMASVRKAMGDKLFMDCVTMTMKNVDNYLPEKEKETCVRIQYGKRAITLKKRT